MQKKLFILTVCMLLISIIFGISTYALPATINEVKVDGNIVVDSLITPINILDLERSQKVEVRVKLTAISDIDNVQVEAVMRGSDFHETVEDLSDTFNMKSGVSYVKKLSLVLPSRLEQDKFRLRVRADSRSGDTTSKDYEIQISSKRHSITIKDILLNPENDVKAGRTLLASLRLKNTGQKDEKGVKVRISIPELGISASDFVNKIEKEGQNDDQATSSELFLRIPQNTETGLYTLKAEALFRDGDEFVAKETKIRVIGEEKEEKL